MSAEFLPHTKRERRLALSFCEKIYLGKNIEEAIKLFCQGGDQVVQSSDGQTQGSYSSNTAQYLSLIHI